MYLMRKTADVRPQTLLATVLHFQTGVAVKAVMLLYPVCWLARLVEVLLSRVGSFRRLQHHTDRPAMSARTSNSFSCLLELLLPFLFRLIQEIALTHSS